MKLWYTLSMGHKTDRRVKPPKKLFETHPQGNRAARRSRGSGVNITREYIAKLRIVQKLYKPLQEEKSLMKELKETVTFNHAQ